MKVSHDELKAVLDAVGILGSDVDPATLPTRTDSAVKRIVPTDVLSFEAFGDDRDYRGPLWYSPVGSVPLERLQVIAELVYDHLLVEDAIGKRLNQAVTVSDYQTLSQFKLTPIYNEFFRHINTDRQMTVGLGVSPELTVTASLCRLRRDFSQRERSVMELLTPHLIAAFRNAKFIDRLKSEALLVEAKELARCASISLDTGMVPQIESQPARRLLQEYFGSQGDSLPDGLQDYAQYHLSEFRKDDYYRPPHPYVIQGKNGKLLVHLTHCSLSRSATLFLEEIPSSRPNTAQLLPLTLRETEVLTLISRGKTDGEIGLLLNISIRTVHKHVEHIFDKLGVETRTAAMARFLEA